MSESLGAGSPGRAGRSEREFHLAGRLVQPELNRISHDGTTAQVEPKVMQVLLRLCERPGEVVSKQELLERVWQGVFVTEDVLVRAVGELRRVFGDDSETPRVIETIRTRGYRLIAPVVFDMAREPGWAEARPSEPAPRSRWRSWLFALAVLAVLGLAWRGPRLGVSSHKGAPRFAPLTSLEGNEYDPALSPDGTRVAFGWDHGTGGPADLYVKLADGEAPLQLTAEQAGDRAPVWSADGTRIAFLRHGSGRCEVRVIGALGGPSQLLAPCPGPHNPRFSWSPDGRRLAVSRGAALHGVIALLALDTGVLTDLTSAAGDHSDISPVFSPDGRQIAFLRNFSDSVGDVWVVDARGGAPRQVTSDNADVMGVTWVDEGRAVAISSNRAGMYSLWRVPIAGGAPELLAGGGRKMKHPTASRDGRVVAYEAWNYDMNLWRLSLGPSAAEGARVAPASDEWTFEPQLSPDGRRLAFVSTRSGTYELWVCDRDGASPSRLTSFGGPYVGAPRWSPDGRQVVFYVRSAGPAETWIIAAAGGPARKVETGPGESMAPAFSADGQSLYFASRRSGTWEVLKMPAAGGEAHAVTRGGGFASRESPDGRWLYYTRIDRPGLWRQPTAGGSSEAVCDRLQPEDWAAWAVTPASIDWVEHPPGDGPPVLVRRSPGGGPAEIVATLAELGWPGISISTDGREAFYSRVDHHESNLVQMTLPP